MCVLLHGFFFSGVQLPDAALARAQCMALAHRRSSIGLAVARCAVARGAAAVTVVAQGELPALLAPSRPRIQRDSPPPHPTPRPQVEQLRQHNRSLRQRVIQVAAAPPDPHAGSLDGQLLRRTRTMPM